MSSETASPPPDLKGEDALPTRRSSGRLGQLVGLTVSVSCLWLIFSRVSFDELQRALAALPPHYVLVGICCLSFGYAMRIVRWAALLRAGGAKVGPLACVAPFLGSITLNNVLPFRAGDVIRALIFPQALGVTRTTATASLVLERLIDLLTLLMSLGIGVYLSSLSGLPSWLGKTVTILALGGVITLLLVVIFERLVTGRLVSLRASLQSRGSARLEGVLTTSINLFRSLGAMSRPRVLIAQIPLSMLVWLGEAGLFWALLKGLGIAAGLPQALMVMAITTLSTLVPSSPGYVGPFHLAAYSAVLMLGGSEAQGASFAVLAHLGVWLPTTLAGGIAIMMRPGLFSRRTNITN